MSKEGVCNCMGSKRSMGDNVIELLHGMKVNIASDN